MMESSKDNGARWGNKLGYMLILFHLAKHDDPLEYVRKATKVARRKKSSMESVFTFWSGDMVLKLFGIKVRWVSYPISIRRRPRCRCRCRDRRRTESSCRVRVCDLDSSPHPDS